MKRGIWKGGRLARFSRAEVEDWRSEGVEEQKTGRLKVFGGMEDWRNGGLEEWRIGRMEEWRREKWRAGRGEKQRWKSRKCLEYASKWRRHR